MISTQILPTTPCPAPYTVLAFGAWMKNAACLLHGNTVLWSANHGDLDQAENCRALQASIQALLAQEIPSIDAIAHDLHPDFYSSQLAIQTAAEMNIPAFGIQHHHAHLAAVCAEYGLQGKVIGVALDGVGLGDDGLAWGGELLLLEQDNCQRLGHLSELKLPGGDIAAREPWRVAAGILHRLQRHEEIGSRFGSGDRAAASRIISTMLDKNLNCPVTTSTGRWFDAAAGALGICVKQNHEAEAAIQLETLAATYLQATDLSPAEQHIIIDANGVLNIYPLLAYLFALYRDGGEQQAAYGAALFHIELVRALTEWLTLHAQRHAVSQIALGGGCFFNRILRTRLMLNLSERGFKVYIPTAISCGDAGLALGQAWVACQKLHRKNNMEAVCV